MLSLKLECELEFGVVSIQFHRALRNRVDEPGWSATREWLVEHRFENQSTSFFPSRHERMRSFRVCTGSIITAISYILFARMTTMLNNGYTSASLSLFLILDVIVWYNLGW